MSVLPSFQGFFYGFLRYYVLAQMRGSDGHIQQLNFTLVWAMARTLLAISLYPRSHGHPVKYCLYFDYPLRRYS